MTGGSTRHPGATSWPPSAERLGRHFQAMRRDWLRYASGDQPPLSSNAYKVLAFLREHTGQWVTMGQLRRAVGMEPMGFGEPLVSNALAELGKRRIRLESAIHLVDYDEDGYSVAVSQPSLSGPGGRIARENVWMLP